MQPPAPLFTEKRASMTSKTTTKKGKATAGRKAFEPTSEQRQIVVNLVGIGLPQHQIRQAIPWSKDDGKPLDKRTFDKAFAIELDRGVAIADMRLRKRLFDEAVEHGNIAALIFLHKARLGMREVQGVEHTGKDGAPLPPAQFAALLYLPQKDPDPHAAEPVERPVPRAIVEQPAIENSGNSDNSGSRAAVAATRPAPWNTGDSVPTAVGAARPELKLPGYDLGVRRPNLCGGRD